MAQRRADLVERLLAGEPLDASELGYKFEGSHLGIVLCGPRQKDSLALLARVLEARLLTVTPEEGLTWAWLGTRSPLDSIDAFEVAKSSLPETSLAIGEPADGSSGWRLTHRQARAALPLTQPGSTPAVRYAEVALLAAAVQDDLLTTSLQRL